MTLVDDIAFLRLFGSDLDIMSNVALAVSPDDSAGMSSLESEVDEEGGKKWRSWRGGGVLYMLRPSIHPSICDPAVHTCGYIAVTLYLLPTRTCSILLSQSPLMPGLGPEEDHRVAPGTGGMR